MGARRKRFGAKAGTPDIVIETQGGRVIEIELKTENGRLSKSQQARLRESWEMGIPYHICRSLEDVQQVLRKAKLI